MKKAPPIPSRPTKNYRRRFSEFPRNKFEELKRQGFNSFPIHEENVINKRKNLNNLRKRRDETAIKKDLEKERLRIERERKRLKKHQEELEKKNKNANVKKAEREPINVNQSLNVSNTQPEIKPTPPRKQEKGTRKAPPPIPSSRNRMSIRPKMIPSIPMQQTKKEESHFAKKRETISALIMKQMQDQLRDGGGGFYGKPTPIATAPVITSPLPPQLPPKPPKAKYNTLDQTKKKDEKKTIHSSSSSSSFSSIKKGDPPLLPPKKTTLGTTSSNQVHSMTTKKNEPPSKEKNKNEEQYFEYYDEEQGEWYRDEEGEGEWYEENGEWYCYEEYEEESEEDESEQQQQQKEEQNTKEQEQEEPTFIDAPTSSKKVILFPVEQRSDDDEHNHDDGPSMDLITDHHQIEALKRATLRGNRKSIRRTMSKIFTDRNFFAVLQAKNNVAEPPSRKNEENNNNVTSTHKKSGSIGGVFPQKKKKRRKKKKGIIRRRRLRQNIRERELSGKNIEDLRRRHRHDSGGNSSESENESNSNIGVSSGLSSTTPVNRPMSMLVSSLDLKRVNEMIQESELQNNDNSNNNKSPSNDGCVSPTRQRKYSLCDVDRRKQDIMKKNSIRMSGFRLPPLKEEKKNDDKNMNKNKSNDGHNIQTSSKILENEKKVNPKIVMKSGYLDFEEKEMSKNGVKVFWSGYYSILYSNYLLELFSDYEEEDEDITNNKEEEEEEKSIYCFDLHGSEIQSGGDNIIIIHLDSTLHASFSEIKLKFETHMIQSSWMNTLTIELQLLQKKTESLSSSENLSSSRKRQMKIVKYFEEWEKEKIEEEKSFFYSKPYHEWSKEELQQFLHHVRISYKQTIGDVYGHLFKDMSGVEFRELGTEWDDLEDHLEDIGIAEDDHLDILIPVIERMIKNENKFDIVEWVTQEKVKNMFLKMSQGDLKELTKAKPFDEFVNYCSHFWDVKKIEKTLQHILTKNEKKTEQQKEKNGSLKEQERRSYKVKFIITENLQTNRAKQLRRILGVPLSLTTKVGLISDNIKWGMFHAAMSIGPLQVEWVDNSLTLIRSISSEKVILCADVGYVQVPDISSFCCKLGKEIVKWNRNYQYNVLNLSNKRFQANCQQFVEYFCYKVLDLSIVFSEDIEKFMYNMKEYGQTGMVFEMPKSFVNEFDFLKEKSVKFESHQQLDDFVNQFFSKGGIDFQKEFPSQFELLKGFDRAFWLKYFDQVKKKNKKEKGTTIGTRSEGIDFSLDHCPSKKGCPFNL